MQRLHIYGGSKNKSILFDGNHKILSYHLNFGFLINPSIENINNSKLLNDIALKNIDAYSEFVFLQNKKFLEQKKLTFENNLSLYFLTDFSCKRSELFSTFSDFCNILLIRSYLKKNSVDKIIIDQTSYEFYEALRSSIINVPIEIRNLKRNKNHLVKIYSKNLLFFLKVGSGIFLKKFFFLNKYSQKSKSIKKLFLTRYPLHLSQNIEEEKYGEFAKSSSFLVNLFTDDFHQKIGLIEFIKSFRYLSSVRNVYLLDFYLSISDIFKSIKLMFFISNGIQKISKDEFNLNGVNLTSHIKNELFFSIMRIPRLLMWNNSIVRFFNKHQTSTLYYYLHEYPYGRMFTYVIRSNFPNTKLVGFQHGPASRRKILYMAGKNEFFSDLTMLESFPVPDQILAEDPYSAKIYQNAGYINVDIMNKIYRLFYLSRVSRSNVEANTTLIAPGLHDGIILMNLLKNLIIDNHDVKFILKVHPRADNRYKNSFKGLNNLIFSEESISNLLSRVTKVYATYSSVAIEAAMLGVDVEMLDLPGRINESPLYDEDFCCIVPDLKY